MKWFSMRLKLAPLVLALALVAPPVSAQLTDFQVMGSGTVETNCLVTLGSGCTATSSGEATGTIINNGSFVLRLDTGSPTLLNGYPAGPLAGSQQGICLPASSVGWLTGANGDTINFNHVGLVCEEAAPGSPYLYNGTYRITGGTGMFSAAVGGGSVTSTFTRDGATVYLHLHGTIRY